MNPSEVFQVFCSIKLLFTDVGVPGGLWEYLLAQEAC